MSRYGDDMARLLLFAAAREAAGGVRALEIDGATVGDVLRDAEARFGAHFSAVLAHSKVWRNGEPADPGDPADPADEIAVLPPVSGG